MFTAQIINFIFNKTNLLTDLPGYIYVNMIFGFSATMFPLFVVQTYKLAIKSRLVIVTTAIAYINICNFFNIPFLCLLETENQRKIQILFRISNK